jgi:hypothetical protein
MRRVLVDHVRRRSFATRGGDALLVTLDEAVATTAGRPVTYADVGR